jgi:hypothetical protein
MATTWVVGPGSTMRPKRNVRVKFYGELASSVWKKGDILIYDTTTGYAKLAATDVHALILGVAGADATGVTGYLSPVYLAIPDAEFKVVGKAGNAMSNADIGVSYALDRDATNLIWTVDNTDTSHDAVVVLAIDNPAVAGDIQGYYTVRFVQGAAVYGGPIS